MPVFTPSTSIPIARQARRTRSPRWQRPALGVAGILVALVVWEFASRTDLVPATYLPPPTIVFAELFHQFTLAPFWLVIWETALSWIIGLLIACAAAIVLGFAIGLVPFLQKATSSTIEFFRPIPSVALVPLAILVFGVRMEAALLLIVYACFWQMLIQVLYGVADIDPVADETARTYGMNWVARIRHVVWPSALPYIMTGLRLCATLALILTITAGLLIGTPGLGSAITFAQAGAQIPVVYALALVTGLMGLGVNWLAQKLENRLLSWHSSVRGER